MNVLKYLAGAADASAAQSYLPGQTVRLRLDTSVNELSIRREQGEKKTITTSSGGATEFTDTETPGNYRVEAGDKLADLFSVNVFDRRESTIAVAEEVTLGYASVTGRMAKAEQRHEYWRWLLVAMLGILVGEWFLYAKRLG